MENEKTVEILNDILTKAYDAEQGYQKAAERAQHHGGLVAFFNAQSDLRLHFGKEIKQAIASYHGEPDKGASIAGKAHQIWITVKDVISGDDSEEAILEECIRGEDAALKEYDDALEHHDLPADVRDLLTSQRSKIAAALANVKVKEAVAD